MNLRVYNLEECQGKLLHAFLVPEIKNGYNDGIGVDWRSNDVIVSNQLKTNKNKV